MTQVKQNRKQVHEELMKKLFVQNHPYANLEPEGTIFNVIFLFGTRLVLPVIVDVLIFEAIISNDHL